MGEGALGFGPYELAPGRRLLTRDGEPVRLGSRAMGLLLALASRPGELVTKDELLAEVWPNAVIDDGALRVHLAALRKALGPAPDGQAYIANLSGRGYQFVHPVRRLGAAPPPAPQAPRPPAPSAQMFGRDALVEELAEALPQRRLQTLVGPGGMGKTTVALAVANLAAPAYGDGACFVDLAPLADPALVASTLSTALGLPVLGDDPLPGLASHLRDRRLLLVLDNCEHVIDAATLVAETLLRAAPGLRLLATSREPLRAEGEWVRRLEPLSAAAAAELFVNRAASLHGFVMAPGDGEAVAEVCRRLDGVPLAIELAAARIDLFGLAGLVERLDDRFAILVRGRRTALPRQQTLKATLDWSYGLLPPEEQAILRALSAFRGRFDLAAAAAVAGGSEFAVMEGVTSLAAKSLLGAEIKDGPAQYRLLEITRDYALGRLREAGEAHAVFRRHALHMQALMGVAQGEWRVDASTTWRGAYGDLIDDVRGALDWAFSAEGDVALGAGITADSAPLWLELALMGEFHGRTEQALARVRALPEPDDRLELKLTTVLGHTVYETGLTPAASAALTRAAEIAEKLSDPGQQLAALMGLYVDRGAYGEYRTQFGLVDIISDMAHRAGHPQAGSFKDRYLGLALHLMGQHGPARAAMDRAFHRPDLHQRHGAVSGFEFDTLVAVESVRSRVLWVSGSPDQALAGARRAVAAAQALGHSPSLYFALTMAACPVALWTGDLAFGEELLAIIEADAATRVLEHWTTWQRAFGIALAPQRDPAGIDYSGRFMAEHEMGFVPNTRELLATAHPSLLGAWTLDRGETGEGGWCAPEILRARGEVLLRTADGAGAEAYFRRALELARRQGAVGWELRAATSLARMLRARGELVSALEALAPVHGKFDEGHATRDLAEAAELLDLLRS